MIGGPCIASSTSIESSIRNRNRTAHRNRKQTKRTVRNAEGKGSWRTRLRVAEKGPQRAYDETTTAQTQDDEQRQTQQ